MLFLWAEHALAAAFGPSEPVLRLVPLLSAVAAPPVVFLAARTTYGEATALVAAALVASSGYLAFYAVQAKQYSSDALVAVLVLGAVLRAMSRPAEPRRWVAFGVAGVIAVLASQPAVFVLAGCGLAPLLQPEVRRSRGVLRRWLVANSAWVAAFAVLYVLVYRTSDTEYMRAFWDGRYLAPGEPGFARRAIDLGGMLLVELVVGTGRRRAGLVAMGAIAFLWGAFSLVRSDAPRAAALLLPFAAMTAANVLRLYPFEGRLWIALAPFVCLVYGRAAWATASLLRPAWRWRALATLLVLHALVAAPVMAHGATRRAHRLPNRTVVAAMEARRDGLPVYVHPRGMPAYLFYTTDWSAPDTARLRRHARLGTYPGPLFENLPSRGRALGREGDELRFADPGGELVAGLAQGGMFSVRDFSGGRADPGWLENEVRRIREAARSRIWVFISGVAPRERREFLAALERAGGRVLESHGGNTSAGASLVEFDAAAPGAPMPGAPGAGGASARSPDTR